MSDAIDSILEVILGEFLDVFCAGGGGVVEDNVRAVFLYQIEVLL